MIYVKPRRKMSVDRMRRQRGKHHHIRYRVQYFNRDDVVDIGEAGMEFALAEVKEIFRMEVARWNMWRRWPLSTVTLFRDYDIDFDRYKYLFEVRVINQDRRWMDVMDRMDKDKILPPNLLRVAFGLEPL